MKKILIITGPAGDAQGWGDLEVTRQLRDSLSSAGKTAEIVFVETKQAFLDAIEAKSYDIIWSALYHISSRADIVGLSEDDGLWIADILDDRQIPYIGPSALTMKQLINKTWTHRILHENNIAVPTHNQVDAGEKLPDIQLPAFVKPSCESRSVGISDESVVNSAQRVGEDHHRHRRPRVPAPQARAGRALGIGNESGEVDQAGDRGGTENRDEREPVDPGEGRPGEERRGCRCRGARRDAEERLPSSRAKGGCLRLL